MRQWLAVGWFFFLILAAVAVVSFVRGKQNDQQYQTTLEQFRVALKAGASRAQVEDYLRQKGMGFERTCCKRDIFDDRMTIGRRTPKFFCTDPNIYLEFKFDNAAPHAQVAARSDPLKKIDLLERGVCL